MPQVTIFMHFIYASQALEIMVLRQEILLIFNDSETRLTASIY